MKVIEGMQLLLEKHKGQNILIVSHAAATKLLIGYFAGMEIEKCGMIHLCIVPV